MKYGKLKKLALSVLFISMIFSSIKMTYAKEVITNEQIIASVSEDGIKKEPGDVVIHYRPNDNNHQYYLYVWNTGTSVEKTFIKMIKNEQPGKQKEQYAIVKAGQGKNKFNYLIVSQDRFDNTKPNDGKVINDMVVPVNEYTATDVFHNEKDGWYSLFLNVQTKDFDVRYGYKDKIVDPTTKTFKVVGKQGALGATLNKDGSAKVNVWAPTANKVNIRLYKSVNREENTYKTLSMIRGQDKDYSNHENNTNGLWSIELKKDELKEYGYSSMENVAYEFEITAPHSYFVQKSEHWEKQANNEWKYVSDKYINSADSSSMKTTEGKEKIAEFYTGEPKTVVTQDPYSIATIRDGNRSVILDPSLVGKKVVNSKNKRADKYTKISVMEMNVRDFSIAKNSGIKEENKGNYLGVIEKDTKNPDTKQITGLDYLEYLGVKYVQVLPVSDYETVPELLKDDEKNNEISDSFRSDDQQNWGYDPKNYNVPEGSYASDPADPKNRIKELKQMVQGLHDSGINMVMDVVYNHLYAGQKNPFEYTVPGYFYAINGDGKMNNDVGVGNAIRGNNEMMRRYIVNSIAYWALEYGMDGFRFDAMSDLDVDTLNEVRKTLDIIDPKICTYGEGWDSMGKYLSGSNPAGSISNAAKIPGYAFFDSKGRDAIAGSVYDSPNPAGFVNNESSYHKNTTDVCDSMLGGHKGKSYLNASQQLNYVEVHDGKTLADLMKHYNPHDDPKGHKKRAEFATAMSTLSQGINFIQIGQEFLKSKDNKHNTYNAGDKYNMINWNQVKENIDSVNFMKSLLTFRQTEELLQKSDFNEINSVMKITNAKSDAGIITYELTNPKTQDKYLVIFNNNRMQDNERKLIIGKEGNNYYYGADLKNGNINGNDFSNAFIVASNSENLYDKIGKFNNQPNITMEFLTTTILYIPHKPSVKLEKKTQNISYLQNDKEISQKNIQTLSLLTVDYTNPQDHFIYEKSGITTNNDKDLGHNANVLSKMTPLQRNTKKYYATDKAGNLIDIKDEPKLDQNGKPINSENVVWHEATGDVTTKEVVHPTFEDKQVVSKDSELADLNKVKAAPLNQNRDINIKYDYKEVEAKIISDNDPDKKITSNPIKDYISIGKINSNIIFKVSDQDLKREGYSYTVNGFKTLKEALVNKKYKVKSNENIFKVIYTPLEASIKVEYYDQDLNKVLDTETVKGYHGKEIKHTLKIFENYELVSNELDNKIFNALTTNKYRVIYKHIHHKSKYSITLTLIYPTLKEDKQIDYDVNQDMVTKEIIYTPQIKSLNVEAKDIPGYKIKDKNMVINFDETKAKPINFEVIIPYEKIDNSYTIMVDDLSPQQLKDIDKHLELFRKDNKYFEVYDIYLINSKNEKITLDKEIEVKVKLKKNFKTLNIYHIRQDDKLEKINYDKLSNNEVTFKAKNFSPFIFVENNKQKDLVIETNELKEIKDKSLKNNPKTFDNISISYLYLFVLSSITLLMLLLKLKKNINK